MSRRLVVASLLGALAGGVVATALVGGSGAAAITRPRRVLIFSLPHVSWADLEDAELPTLNGLLDRSAIAALTIAGLTGGGEERITPLADGYLTIGAGTRAVGDRLTDGDSLQVDEPFGSGTAGAAYARRTGRSARRGIVSLGETRLVERNEDSLYEADIGALGTALRDAGYARAVVGNGDGRRVEAPPPTDTSQLRRAAALALSDRSGRLPAGRVDEGLLRHDPRVPFGRRLDRDAVVGEFTRVYKPRSVVLVEASDLVRADAYRELVTATRSDHLRARALAASDRLLARLLEHVDLERDAVIVVGPTHSGGEVGLAVLAVHTPGGEAGLLQSSTTRRPGFVQLIDVAPTALELLGIERPPSMDGRPAVVEDTGGTAAGRREMLVRADAAALFRNSRVGEAQLSFVLLAALVVIATIVVFGSQPSPRAKQWLGRLALCALAFVPASYLTRLLPLDEAGVVAYWSYILVLSVLIGTLYYRCGRSDPLDALLVALLVNIFLFSADVVFGSVLQFNSALGYSPTVSARFVGFSNPAYAALGASSVIAAPLLARRIGPPRGLPVALGLLGAVIVVDGAPFWGSDVGGILSMVPAFGITAALMAGLRIRGRTVLWCLVGLAAALTAFTVVDLARPAEERTHLGRLVEQIDERGLGEFVVVVQRKLARNLATLTNAIWGWLLPIAGVFAWWLVRRSGGRARVVLDEVPELRVSAVGFAILAVLGYLLNDSGIAIPGMMLAIALGCAVWLLSTVGPPTERGAASPPTSTPAATR